MSVYATNDCSVSDVEISEDAGAAYYVPSRCSSLRIDGDSDNLDKFIAAVEMHSSLKSLDFSRDPRRARFDGGVSRSDLELLLGVLSKSKVLDLNLAFNQIGDSGVALIADALASINLESLNLETSGVNAEGAEALASALKKDNSNLATLNLAHNNIAGAVEHLISAAKAHSKLKTIGDEGTLIGRSESFDGHSLRSLLSGSCVASPWSEWECPGKCGAASTATRSRHILHKPHTRHLSEDGCPHALQETKPCVVECENIKSKPKARKENHAVPETSEGEGSAVAGDMREEETTETPPPVASYRERLKAFYSEYNPEKLGEVDAMLAKFEGREESLFISLVKKYGPEP